MLFLYMGSFTVGFQATVWVYPPEILPLSIRAKGASLSTAANWSFNWLVGEMTPILQDAIKWRLYLVHAFFCAVSFVVGKLFTKRPPQQIRILLQIARTISLTHFLSSLKQSGSFTPKRPTCAWKT